MTMIVIVHEQPCRNILRHKCKRKQFNFVQHFVIESYKMQKKYSKGLSVKFFRIVNFYKNFENMPLNRVFFFIWLFPKVILKLQKSIIRE